MTLKKTIWTAAMLLTTMTMSAADAQWNDVTKKYVKRLTILCFFPILHQFSTMVFKPLQYHS